MAGDLAQWRAGLANALLEGMGSVEIQNGSSRRVTVIVQWNDQRATAGAAAAVNRQFRVDTRL